MKDGMIFDVAGCNFKPADLQCPAGKMEGCVSKEQVDALQTAFAGPKDSRGNGRQVADYLNSLGIAAFVLRYRLVRISHE